MNKIVGSMLRKFYDSLNVSMVVYTGTEAYPRAEAGLKAAAHCGNDVAVYVAGKDGETFLFGDDLDGFREVVKSIGLAQATVLTAALHGVKPVRVEVYFLPDDEGQMVCVY